MPHLKRSPRRPLFVLDLCCCQGGAAAGYARAGLESVGVDLDHLVAKRYPGVAFRHDDALDVLRRLIAGEAVTFTRRDGTTIDLYLSDFAFIHVSPPCQGYTRGNAGRVTSWPKLIPDFRQLLEQTGLPYVIENVEDAGPEMLNPIGLCGCMFDLAAEDADGFEIRLKRLRLFETNWGMASPRPCAHDKGAWFAGAYGGARKAFRLPWESNVEVAPRDRHVARYVRKGGYVPREKTVVAALLGVDHEMTWGGLYECIPPAYAEWIGLQLRTALIVGKAVGHAVSDLR